MEDQSNGTDPPSSGAACPMDACSDLCRKAVAVDGAPNLCLRTKVEFSRDAVTGDGNAPAFVDALCDPQLLLGLEEIIFVVDANAQLICHEHDALRRLTARGFGAGLLRCPRLRRRTIGLRCPSRPRPEVGHGVGGYGGSNTGWPASLAAHDANGRLRRVGICLLYTSDAADE